MGEQPPLQPPSGGKGESQDRQGLHKEELAPRLHPPPLFSLAPSPILHPGPPLPAAWPFPVVVNKLLSHEKQGGEGTIPSPK